MGNICSAKPPPATADGLTGSTNPEKNTASAGETSPALIQLLGDSLITKDGLQKTADISSLKGCKAVAIYFSAHWCPPCRHFTPQLASFHTELAAKGLEIVFASSDQDQGSFDEYYGEMPWLALPFGASLKDSLSTKYGVRGIPALVIVNAATGELITAGGRGDSAHIAGFLKGL